MLKGVLYIRRGQHVYRRIAGTNIFRLEMVFASVGKARRFCTEQPEGRAVRWNWVQDKLKGGPMPTLREW